MATATSFTAARMLEIEETTVVAGLVDVDGNLLLTNRRGEEINAGSVVGPPGPPGADGSPGTLPVGAILHYPKDSPLPSYALECNGAAVSRSIYSSLFAVIGTKWGVGNGSTTFNVPNFQNGKSNPLFEARIEGYQNLSTGAPVFSTTPRVSRGFGVWNGQELTILKPGWYDINFLVLVENNVITTGRIDIQRPPSTGWQEEAVVVLTSAGRSVLVKTQYYLLPGDKIRPYITMNTSSPMAYPSRNYFSVRYLESSGQSETPDTRPIIIATDQGQGVTIIDGNGGYKLGTIQLWPGSGPIPANHLELNGQSLSSDLYSGLAALFPEWISGPGLITLPDWRQHTAAGQLAGDPTFGTIGAKIGSLTHSHSSGGLFAALYAGYLKFKSSVVSWTATNSNNMTIPGTNSSTNAGGPSIEGSTATASSIQPTVVAKWIICIADSAGEYSPTVQTAMVSSIIDLNSKTKKITAVARRNGSAYTHPTGNWVLFTDSIMSETENVGIPSGFLAPGYWLIPENGIYAVQISLFLPTTANIILVLKKNNTVAGDGGAFAGNSNVGTSSWSANTVYAEETFIAGDTVSAALFASGYGGSVNVTPSSALTQFRLRKISS